METKTQIIYASKYGCAQKCAEILSKKIDGPVDLVNIQGNVSDLSTLDALEQYDKVVIGGINSVWSGSKADPRVL